MNHGKEKPLNFHKIILIFLKNYSFSWKPLNFREIILIFMKLLRIFVKYIHNSWNYVAIFYSKLAWHLSNKRKETHYLLLHLHYTSPSVSGCPQIEQTLGRLLLGSLLGIAADLLALVSRPMLVQLTRLCFTCLQFEKTCWRIFLFSQQKEFL